MDNCTYSTRKLLTLINVPYTIKFLKDSLLSHPYYPSLLSISDTLNKYSIENISVKLEKKQINELVTPCLVQVSTQGDSLFYILHSISRNKISYYDDKGELRTSSRESFLDIWTGVCLLAEKSSESGEVDYEKKRKIGLFWNLIKAIIIVSSIIWLGTSLFNFWQIINVTEFTLIFLYAIVKLVGLISGIFLLWYEVDEFSPTLQNFCSGGRKTSCSSVLSSKYAKMFADSLTLSILGFSYFFGTFLYLLLSDYSTEAVSISSLLSLMTIPVIGLSFYYQAFVIKQWCRLCIVVQIVLSLEVMIVLFGKLYLGTTSLSSMPFLLTVFLAPILLWHYLKPLLEKDKESDYYKRSYRRVANNKNYFADRLKKSRKVELPPDQLGIRFNQKNARYNIIKVCNPYCGPCAEAHPILAKLYKSGIINMQVIFSSPPGGDDLISRTVKHLMAIYSQKNQSTTHKALDYWYTNDEKQLENLENKFPASSNLQSLSEAVISMSEWCKIAKITHTPTIFINGYELPEEYAVEDLLDIL